MNLENLTPNEYQQGALETESKVTPEVMARYMRMRGLITETFTELRPGLLLIDAIKKYIFYGKVNPVLELKPEDDWNAVEQPTEQDIKFIRFLHAVLGIMSECEEKIDPSLAGMQHPATIDVINGVEEFGDDGWYIAIGCHALGVTFLQMLIANLKKLDERYKGRVFNALEAINRDHAAEKDVMAAVITKSDGTDICSQATRTRELLIEAGAQAFCTKENQEKALDSDLIDAFVDISMKKLYPTVA